MLHTVGYDDGGRTRSILHRASISEMVVPYGDPGPVHGWKNAFDAGEWGLGSHGQLARARVRLPRRDPLPRRGRSPTSRATPTTTTNAICIHEEDVGILWKHVDLLDGRTEVRRSRRLVVSSIATVGNYEYGFYWYFYLDGSHRARGEAHRDHVDRGRRRERERPRRRRSPPGLAAPVHQHLFCARLDFDVDGPSTRCTRSTSSRCPPATATRGATASRPVATRLEPRAAGPRGDVDPARSRSWKIVNPAVAQPARPAGRLQARARRHARRCSPARGSSIAAPGRLRHRRTCGSRRTRPTSAAPPATTPTSTPAATACPAGRRPTARSSTPTSWCGTRSASPTSPAPRTGRSCRSSAAASASPPSASSTATRPSTSRPPEHCH